MFNEGFLLFPDVNDFWCHHDISISHFVCFSLLLYIVLTICLLIGWEPTANFGNQHDVQIYTVNSRLVDTPLSRTLAITDKIRIPGKSYGGLTENHSRHYGLSLLRNYGHFHGTKVTILLFWLSIKRTLCTSHVTLCKITLHCLSFAKIHFKGFPECLFKHRFLKLSAQSSSLLHLSLRVFLPGSLGKLKPSCSILNGCWTVSVLLISSSSLGSPCI